jgi:FlaA1/EpsC-like NDP-sugar epimerase
VILIDGALCVLGISGLRLGFRQIRLQARVQATSQPVQRVGIIGAGDTGAMLVSDLLDKPNLGLLPVAFFDDFRPPNRLVHGVEVVGRPDQLAEFQAKLQLDEIIIAMPSAPAKRIREIALLVRAAGLKCRTVPALDELVTGRVSVSTLRPIQIQDLLGRAPVVINASAVRDMIAGQVVMVTGAGGSIGSELCRQILSFGPAALLLVERSEPQLFAIEQELHAAPNGDAIVPLIGDVTHQGRMHEIFRRFRPHMVFHAAAHKHVPLMEAQPSEAIRNNIFGTALVAKLAMENAVERFVLISTDKAVNPTSAMGASKRFAELYLQSLAAQDSATKFMAVRFGNVLGSSGSVVPTFTRQIAAGGPVTVTHPAMARFFMTIPEAVTLVLQSAALGEGGDIFVLDMGKPVKIADLARQMIELSGLRPGEDIEIVYTGLRPGEKLYEELSHSLESVVPTAHPKIMRHIAAPPKPDKIFMRLDELASALCEASFGPDDLKRLLAKTVVEYQPHPSPTAVVSRPPMSPAATIPA